MYRVQGAETGTGDEQGGRRGAGRELPACVQRRAGPDRVSEEHAEPWTPPEENPGIGRRVASMSNTDIEWADMTWNPAVGCKHSLDQPERKVEPQNIFVCSAPDLFGDLVPDEWIETVFAACEKSPQHRYIFWQKLDAGLPIPVGRLFSVSVNFLRICTQQPTSLYSSILAVT